MFSFPWCTVWKNHKRMASTRGKLKKLINIFQFGKNIVALAKNFSYEKTNNEQFIYFIIIDNIFRSYRSSSGLKIQ